jgi:hypothetical protein
MGLHFLSDCKKGKEKKRKEKKNGCKILLATSFERFPFC